jgi:drug/metabolite transporter (DMT)-like permease
MKAMVKSKASVFLLCSMVLMWGLGYPINKIGLSYTSPTHFIEWRFCIGTVAMFLIAAATKNLIFPHLKDLPMIFAIGLFQMGITLNLSNFGLSLVDAGKATFLVFATSIWIIPFSIPLTKRIHWLEVIAFCIGALGVVILITPWENQIGIGNIALLLASISWSIGILCARYMKWHRPSLQLLPWQLLLATLCTIALAFVQGVPFMPHTLNPIFIGTLLYTGILSIAIGYWAMIIVSRDVSPAIVSLGLIFTPVISLIVSLFFLHEEVSATLMIGVTLITVGVLFHIYSEWRTRKLLQLYEKV